MPANKEQEYYKITDFWEVLKSKTTSFIKNHLFFWFFFFFIVFIGSFGMWVKPVFIDEFAWVLLLESFNSLNLIAFSLPLLVTLMFDKVVSLAAKGEVEDSGLLIWSSIIGISALIIIGVLFGLGFKESIDKFSWFSLIAWLIVLYMWVLCNVDNPNYQKKTDGKTTSGGKDVDYATLKDE